MTSATAMAASPSSRPERAELLVPRGLDADALERRIAERCGEARTHRRDVGRELRHFGHDRGVDVADAPAALVHQLHDLGEQLEARAFFQRGIGVGEVLAQIAQRERAQQGVRRSRGERVGVGVAGEARVDAAPSPRRGRAGAAPANGCTS